MKKIFFVSMVLGILLLSGCAEVFTDTQEQTGTSTNTNQATPVQLPIEQSATSTPAVGTTSQDVGSTTQKMTLEQAIEIAQKSDCIKEGAINSAKENFYNENSKTWWIGLDVTKEGCNPACVVSEDTQTAEINWRCTGLIVPKE